MRAFALSLRTQPSHSAFALPLPQWNCHSFLAGFLNNIRWPTEADGLAHALGCWTVAGVGLRIFLDGRYIADGGGARRISGSDNGASNDAGSSGGGHGCSSGCDGSDGGGGGGRPAHPLLTRGAVQQWGGSVGVSTWVIATGVWSGSWELARGWAYTLLVCNGFLVLWFGFLAACRVASQRGSVSADEDDEDEGEDDSSDDDLCRMGL